MKIATVLACIALAVSCGAPSGDAPRPGPDPVASASATPTTTPSTSPTPSPSASAPTEAPSEPLTQEQIEALNDGCRLRKSTEKISRCEAQPSSVGAWKPTKAEIAPALKLGAGLCYCAKPIEKAVLTCMDSAKAPLVRVVIGSLDDPTDCGVGVSTAEFGGRRFVRMLADNRDRATFYQVEAIVELTAGGAVAYYEGFEPLTDAMVQGADKGLSHQLRADWATLAPDAKLWLTTRP